MVHTCSSVHNANKRLTEVSRIKSPRWSLTLLKIPRQELWMGIMVIWDESRNIQTWKVSHTSNSKPHRSKTSQELRDLTNLATLSLLLTLWVLPKSLLKTSRLDLKYHLEGKEISLKRKVVYFTKETHLSRNRVAESRETCSHLGLTDLKTLAHYYRTSFKQFLSRLQETTF